MKSGHRISCASNSEAAAVKCELAFPDLSLIMATSPAKLLCLDSLPSWRCLLLLCLFCLTPSRCR